MFSSFRRALRAHQGGFTLVEVIVAISIIVVGVIGTMGLATKTLAAGADNERRVNATNLAREGIELVRNIRDSNWARQAEQRSRNVPVGQQRSWDCYVNTYAEATTLEADGAACDGYFHNLSSGQNFLVSTLLEDGRPFLANGSGLPNTDPAVTRAAEYRLCQSQSAPPQTTVTYMHPSHLRGSQSCVANTQDFYRRVTVSRGKDLGGGNYSIKVRSAVNWPTKKGNDIVMEEYLTDWQGGPAAPVVVNRNVTINVNQVTAAAGCSAAGSPTTQSITYTLTPGYPNQTNSAGTATFANVPEGTTPTASYSGLPAGWTACAPTSQAIGSTGAQTITFKIQQPAAQPPVVVSGPCNSGGDTYSASYEGTASLCVPNTVQDGDILIAAIAEVSCYVGAPARVSAYSSSNDSCGGSSGNQLDGRLRPMYAPATTPGAPWNLFQSRTVDNPAPNRVSDPYFCCTTPDPQAMYDNPPSGGGSNSGAGPPFYNGLLMQKLYWKVWRTGDPQNYSFTWPSGSRGGGGILKTFRGISQTDPIDVHGANTYLAQQFPQTPPVTKTARGTNIALMFGVTSHNTLYYAWNVGCGAGIAGYGNPGASWGPGVQAAAHMMPNPASPCQFIVNNGGTNPPSASTNIMSVVVLRAP